MNLEFKKFEPASSSSLEVVPVIDIIGNKGKVRIPNKSFYSEEKNEKGERVRCFAILVKEDGTSTGISCSKQLSEDLRAFKIKEENLLAAVITEDATTKVPFLSMPSSGFIEIDFSKYATTVDNFVPSVMSYEELAC